MEPKTPTRVRTFAPVLIGVALVLLLACAALSMFFRGGPRSDFAYDSGGTAPMATAYPEASSSATDEEVGYVPAMEATQSPAQAPVDRLIIRNGSMTLVVSDTRATQQQIEQMVAGMAGEGAFLVSSTERSSGRDASPYIDMSLRIPATRFDATMDAMGAMALEVQGRTESADDVTEEYVDLSARLASLEAARDRLRTIMENAETTEELLLAEQQLTDREAEIESIKGRMQYLSESARLSSITLSLVPDVLSQPVDTSWRPAKTARDALEALIRSLRDMADFLITFVIAILPWLLVFGLVGYLAYRLVRNLWRSRKRS